MCYLWDEGPRKKNTELSGLPVAVHPKLGNRTLSVGNRSLGIGAHEMGHPVPKHDKFVHLVPKHWIEHQVLGKLGTECLKFSVNQILGAPALVSPSFQLMAAAAPRFWFRILLGIDCITNPDRGGPFHCGGPFGYAANINKR